MPIYNVIETVRMRHPDGYPRRTKRILGIVNEASYALACAEAKRREWKKRHPRGVVTVVPLHGDGHVV